MCNHLVKPDLFGAEHRVLRGFAFQSVRVVSRAACARDCILEYRCLSINYFEEERLCELNNATRSQYQENFDILQGSFYMDYDKNTTLLEDGGQQLGVLQVASCEELLQAGLSVGHRFPSGIYSIYPNNQTTAGGGLRVYCDMETDGGGWIVFQRRQDGSMGFYLSWAAYRAGFGDLAGEFWLGNDNLRALTEGTGKSWDLRIDMEDWDGETAWAEYGDFSITGNEYVLRVNTFNKASTAQDSLLETHNGQPFSTPDHDNDGNFFLSCSSLNGGAWWYKNCHDSNLNGVYLSGSSAPYNQGIQWESWRGDSYSLKKCSMKMREII
ncbi:microfibril-associated glycoprotein 4-like [Patiria miniata]|uniref:Fibrinogen C-terminal domain-containing protein n=1 Tax=Patiria miniata TaxID=46514 RepID=A0A914BMW6_PATMI|nr:microfibril-associated glycoprotein 4-like [Patiria miniata]